MTENKNKKSVAQIIFENSTPERRYKQKTIQEIVADSNKAISDGVAKMRNDYLTQLIKPELAQKYRDLGIEDIDQISQLQINNVTPDHLRGLSDIQIVDNMILLVEDALYLTRATSYNFIEIYSLAVWLHRNSDKGYSIYDIESALEAGFLPKQILTHYKEERKLFPSATGENYWANEWDVILDPNEDM